jgi:hypothetical protein
MAEEKSIGSRVSIVSRNYARYDKKKLKIFLFFILSFFFIILAFQFYRPAIYKELYALKLIPEDEHFTELYFEDYGNLPQKSIKGEALSFSFTIKNDEGIDKQYPYIVYFENNGEKFVLDDNTVPIKYKESRTIKESYVYSQDYAKETLFVELPQQRQRVYFLLTDND